MSVQLSSDHQDALQELMNISMGRAAGKLAMLLESHVTLSIPSIWRVSDAELLSLVQNEERCRFTRQSFYGDIDGEVITQLSKKGCDYIVGAMHGKSNVNSAGLIEESLLDISNILSGASLQGFTKQLDLVTQISPPMLFKPSLQALPIKQWRLALWIEIVFLVDQAEFEARTVVCLADNGLEQMLSHLDQLLEG